MRRRVELQPYDFGWSARFQVAQTQLQSMLGDLALAIHHIGSTSVPGLLAKPTIDILIEVRDLTELDARASRLSAAGYIWRGENGISGRRYLHLGDLERSQHVHCFETGHPAIARHLRFRDFLRSHPEAAERYAKAKQRALILSEGNPSQYQELKAETIALIEQLSHASSAD